MPPHPLTISEIQKYCQNEGRLNGVYSISNSPKIKDRAYVTNLDEYKSIEACWIALCMNGDNVIIALELNIFQKKNKSL